MVNLWVFQSAEIHNVYIFSTCNSYCFLLIVGVVQLKIPNLDAIGRKITFGENLPLAMFRSKQCDIRKYLLRKNEVNKTVSESQRVLLIPEDLKLEELRKKVDTTRVRLCFQVEYII